MIGAGPIGLAAVLTCKLFNPSHLVVVDKAPAPGLVTHRFGVQEMQDAYDVFSKPAETDALKVVLYRSQHH